MPKAGQDYEITDDVSEEQIYWAYAIGLNDVILIEWNLGGFPKIISVFWKIQSQPPSILCIGTMIKLFMFLNNLHVNFMVLDYHYASWGLEYDMIWVLLRTHGEHLLGLFFFKVYVLFFSVVLMGFISFLF